MLHTLHHPFQPAVSVDYLHQLREEEELVQSNDLQFSREQRQSDCLTISDISYSKTGWKDTIYCRKINNKKRSIYITVYTDLKIIFGGFSKKLHHCSIISMTIKFHIIQLNVVTNGKHIGNQPTTNQPRCRALGDVQVEIVQMQWLINIGLVRLPPREWPKFCHGTAKKQLKKQH